jgi:hypothetical protein
MEDIRMDLLGFASIWCSIAIALVLLLKAQAQRFAEALSELEMKRKALAASSANILPLGAGLDNIEDLNVGDISKWSRDLRTRVLAIREAAEAITTLQGQREPETARRFGRTILREADRLAGMIENTFSGITSTEEAK